MANSFGFKCVAEWVQGDKDIRAVVVSAGGKTDRSKKVTDLLIDANKQTQVGVPIKRALIPFVERVLCDAETLGLGGYIKDELMIIEQEIEKDFSLDFLLSRGEYFYAKLFSFYYGIPFVDSKNLIGFYEDGKLNLGLCEYQILNAYKKFGQFVCGGFYGALPNGKVKVFSRGGSDFSGAIITRGLKAKEYLNFTDVDGIYSFDPKEKSSAMITEISFDTVRLLGEFGTTVLHPASVLPLYGTDAQIRLRNTFNNSSFGTLIKENSQENPFAIACKRGCCYVKIVKRENGRGIIKSIEEKNLKIICSAMSMDFLELCYEGEFGLSTDGLQQKENVTVIYLSPCQKSYELIIAIQKAEIILFCCVFSSGGYIVVEQSKEFEVLQMIYGISGI